MRSEAPEGCQVKATGFLLADLVNGMILVTADDFPSLQCRTNSPEERMAATSDLSPPTWVAAIAVTTGGIWVCALLPAEEAPSPLVREPVIKLKREVDVEGAGWLGKEDESPEGWWGTKSLEALLAADHFNFWERLAEAAAKNEEPPVPAAPSVEAVWWDVSPLLSSPSLDTAILRMGESANSPYWCTAVVPFPINWPEEAEASTMGGVVSWEGYLSITPHTDFKLIFQPTWKATVSKGRLFLWK